MKESTKVVIIFLVMSSLLILFTLLPASPPEFNDIVKNRTVTNYSDFFYNYEINRYPTHVEIGPPIEQDQNITLGVVVDPWNVNFGIVPSNGSYAKRTIDLTNTKNIPTRISFNVFGDILPLVSFSDNNFVLKDGKVSVDVFLFTKNASMGNYSGEMDIIARKPKYIFIPV